MIRNGTDKVKGVWDGYAHNSKYSPTRAIIELARGILNGTVSDNTQGATHFYSPVSMPKQGQPTKGYDVGGGLEHMPGLPTKNYRPSWANEYKRTFVEGVNSKYFKYYRESGDGYVK
jgi:hypothetical protein